MPSGRCQSRILPLVLCGLLCLFQAGGEAFAQNGPNRISGTVVEETTGLPVIQAAVLLLSPDSTLLRGVMSDGQGRFVLTAHPGHYLLKLSLLGYADRYLDIQCTPSQGGMELGSLPLHTEAAFLNSAVVTAKVEPVSVVEDTLVYNPAAFRLGEDAMLEDLLRKIPGLEIDGGSVTLHGKPIRQIYVDGERFFSGNVKAGLKSLTADMVEKINAYERESDYTRLTGVDDGEREPVLDLRIKKGFLDLWKTQSNLGGGTHGRYSERVNANNIGKQKQVTVVLSQRNLSSQAGIGTTGRNQLGTGSAGDRMTREAGVTFSRKNQVLNLNGNLHYDANAQDVLSRNRTENIGATSLSWNHTNRQTESRRATVKSDVTLEWKAGKNNTLYLKTEFQRVNNANVSAYQNGYFTKDPALYVEDPNDFLEQEYASDPLKEARSNTGNNLTHNYNHRTDGGLTFTWTHRFAKRGRTLSFRTKDSYTATEEDLFNNYRTRYYRIASNPDSLQIRSLRSLTRGGNWNLLGQLAWNEPLGKGFHLQLTWRTQREIRTNDKQFYDFSALDPDWTPGRQIDHRDAVANLPEGVETTYREALSATGKYDYVSQAFVASLRFVRKRFNMTLGGTLRPQRTTLTYLQEGIPETLENQYLQIAPNVTLRFTPRKSEQFSFSYNNWASLPSMYQLIPVASGTNPLNYHIGNPDLKPAQVHNLSLSYNLSNIKRQQSLILNGSFRLTEDQICTVTDYDHDTGIRTTKQGNIDGNWRATASAVFNKTFGQGGWSVSNHLGGEYQNNVSYLYNSKKKVDEVNLAPRLMAKEQFDLTYRNAWLETGFNLRGEYTMERSRLRPEVDGDVVNLAAGVMTSVLFPWEMRLGCDFAYMVQRGYPMAELNRNYSILNLSLAQPLLKKKMTLRLEGFDLLGQLSSMTRTFGSGSRSITHYNGVNRYLLFRAILRIGQTGGK